jgi:hypothetical protein
MVVEVGSMRSSESIVVDCGSILGFFDSIIGCRINASSPSNIKLLDRKKAARDCDLLLSYLPVFYLFHARRRILKDPSQIATMLAILLIVCLAVVARAAKDADRVTSLPGWAGELPSTHYSGYISTGKISESPGQLHYWFIESTSKPSEDPVVLWLNGGPGSSSLIGTFEG